MMTNGNRDFLSSFQESILSFGKDPIAFDTLIFFAPYSLKEALDESKTMLTVLDKILSITYKPHIEAIHSDIIQRSETASQLSHESFEETMRDPKLWKNKRGEMVPEYVHSKETIDSLDIYENRFISFLIDRIETEALNLSDNLARALDSIQSLSQHKDVTYGELSYFRMVRNKAKEKETKEVTTSIDNKELSDRIRKIDKRIKNLKSTQFYKKTNGKIREPIHSTNVLVHDVLYSYCYKYYVSERKSQNSLDRRMNILYANYCLVLLYKTMDTMKIKRKDNTLSFDEEGILNVYKTKATKTGFAFELNLNKEHLALEIKTELLGKKKEVKASSTHVLLFRYVYDDVVKDELDYLRVENPDKEYTLVTMSNLRRDFSSVLDISFYKEESSENMKDYLSSLTLVLDREESQLSFCPVCGSGNVRTIEEEHICSMCHSHYYVLEHKTWIEAFGKE